LHQKYYTTEVSFAYKELDCINEAHIKIIEKSKNFKKSILHQYYSDKKNNLKTYQGVLETLKKLKQDGVLVIGFTESNSFFTKTRIKQLELDGLFDCIYTPIGTGIPESTTRFYSEDHWEPKLTEIRHLSVYDKKPNVEILEIILRDFKLKKENTIYVGDKLDRDIQMAIDVGLTSVFANYGHGISGEKYELLKEVTHWSDADVQREILSKEAFKNRTINPTYELKSSFQEILNIFDFVSNRSKLNIELLPNVISTWSKVVDVQQHFNDIALKIRNLFLTVFTFIVAGLGYILKENIIIQIFEYKIKLAFLFCLLGALIMYSFYLMDKYWYHKFLIGASKQAGFIEDKWHKQFNELGLSNSISKESRFKREFKIFGKVLYSNTSSSNRRFSHFYKPSILILIGLAFVFQFLGSTNNIAEISVEDYNNQIKEHNFETKFLEEKSIQLLKEKGLLIKENNLLKDDLNKADSILNKFKKENLKKKK
jgi:FMN phosphatase YigB (HAD superfamily)